MAHLFSRMNLIYLLPKLVELKNVKAKKMQNPGEICGEPSGILKYLLTEI